MTTEDLRQQRCVPRKGAEHALSVSEIKSLLGQLSGWALSDDGKTISRELKFRNFDRTMAFVNAVAWIAHTQDHHPDMEVGYGRCLARLSTHDVGGLSKNDFIVAARIDALVEDLG